MLPHYFSPHLLIVLTAAALVLQFAFFVLRAFVRLLGLGFRAVLLLSLFSALVWLGVHFG